MEAWREYLIKISTGKSEKKSRELCICLTEEIEEEMAYPFTKTITFANSPYTILDTDYTIFGDAVGGEINVILPLAASFPGRILVFKKIDSGVDRVVLNRNVADKIEDVAANYNINAQFETVIIQSDGTTNWWIVGEAI